MKKRERNQSIQNIRQSLYMFLVHTKLWAEQIFNVSDREKLISIQINSWGRSTIIISSFPFIVWIKNIKQIKSKKYIYFSNVGNSSLFFALQSEKISAHQQEECT